MTQDNNDNRDDDNEAAAVANYFKAQGAADSNRRFIGDLVKFTKGEWSYGQDGIELEAGTQLVVVMPTFTTGWLKWRDHKPVAHDTGAVWEGFMPAKRENLDEFVDRSAWEVDKNKQPKDPWQPNRTVVLADPESNALYTFSTQSKGGIGTLGELQAAYGQRMRMAPDELPVVEIGSGSYRHKDYGKVPFPTLKVVDWVDGQRYVDLVNEAKGIGNGAAKQVTAAKPKLVTSSAKAKANFFPNKNGSSKPTATKPVEAKPPKGAKNSLVAAKARKTKAAAKAGKSPRF